MKRFFLLYFLCLSVASAQTFFKSYVPVTENNISIGNAFAGGLNSGLLSAIDLNQDGVQDVFVFDNTTDRITTYLHSGLPNNTDYTYAPQYETQFPALKKWAFLVDYNCDGKPDIFTRSDSVGSIALYRNDYQPATGLLFTLITNEIPATVAGISDKVRCSNLGETYTRFADIDKDGDIDALGWPDPATGRIAYYENKAFDLGLPCDSLKFELVSLCWGNFQLAFGSNSISAFNIFCLPPKPAPVDKKPVITKSLNYHLSQAELAKTTENATVAQRDDTITSLFPFDIDADNDMDLLIGDVGSHRALLAINGGTNTQALMTAQDTVYPNGPHAIEVYSYINFSAIDANNDGKQDLIATANRESVNNSYHLLTDISTTSVPDFTFVQNDFLQGKMIDLGVNAYPAFFDYNSDGLLDLAVGNNYYEPMVNNTKVGLALFVNTGTATQPQYNLTTRNFADFSSIAIGINAVACAPAFGDLDADGDADMIIGTESGRLFYYTNTPIGSLANFTLVTPFLDSIDVGNFSMPSIVDLNNDGLLDLVVGKRNGRINYYQNTGTSTLADFNKVPTNDTLGKVVLLTNTNGVTGYTTPSFYKNNGLMYMMVGNEKGEVLIYDSITNNINGAWRLNQTTVITGTQGTFTAPAAADINNDGYTDFMLGNAGGGLALFLQQNPTAIAPTQLDANSFRVQPNPANHWVEINANINKPIQLTILQINGAVVYRQTLLSNLRLPLKSFENGVYIISFEVDGMRLNKRLVVLH
jgi:hypothetical protein